MSKDARQILKQLLNQHGPDLVNQPDRVKGLLLDLCTGQMRETNLLFAVVKHGMARELLQDGGKNLPILIPRMTKRLHEDLALDKDMARWALETWAVALGFTLPVDQQGPGADSNRVSDRPGAGSTYSGGGQETPFKEEGGAVVTAPPHPHQSSAQPKHGEAWTEPYTGMEFVWVPGGTFKMGDLFGDGYAEEKPVHTVELDEFWLGKYLVTQAQWARVKGNNPSSFKVGPARQKFLFQLKQFMGNNPVEKVSWDNAQEFIRTLNTRSPATGFRLPTEAEWEYAARAGTRTSRYWGNDINCSRANYGNSFFSDECKGKNPAQTSAVGSYPPNPWGLYDMLGNVDEWCHDWYEEDYYTQSPRRNPTGPGHGSVRVLRGGSWRYDSRYVRAAHRRGNIPGLRSPSVGFRLALSPGQQ